MTRFNTPYSYDVYKRLAKSILFCSIVCLTGSNLFATTFTATQSGNWNASSTWGGGPAPGAMLGTTDIVNISGFTVIYNLSSDLFLSGIINITADGTLQFPISGNGQGRSITLQHDDARLIITNADLIMPTFLPGMANNSGNLILLAGQLRMTNAYMEVPQNWESKYDGSGPQTKRILINSCLLVGESYVNEKGIDSMTSVCLEMGRHGSGNFENKGGSPGLIYLNSTDIYLAGNGNFKNEGGSVLTGGTNAIERLFISNGGLENSGSWSAQIVNHCINGNITGIPGGTFLNAENCSLFDEPDEVACGDCTPEFNELTDLSLTKTVDDNTPAIGQNVTFTIIVTNSAMSLSNATGVGVSDTLPAGLTYVSHTVSVGTYSPVTGIWTVGNLNIGASATMTITATVNALPRTNKAQVSAADQQDPDSTPNNNIEAEDDQESVTIQGGSVDITCPANLVMNCVNGANYPAQIEVWIATATGSGGCGGIEITDNYNGTDVPPLSCNLSTGLVVTFTATDDCGSTATCTATAYIDDETNPVINCPASVTISCSASTLPADTGTATATDGCDGSPSITSMDVTVAGGCPQEYTITRTWTAMDDCSNTATCTQTITVDDSTSPSITCPANLTIQCTASTLPSNTGTATATDNCSTPVVTYSDVTLAGGCPQELTITRTWSATDGCGNTSMCTQTIFVDDSTPPAIVCPANVTIQCTASTLPSNTGTATATDNCSTPVVTYSDVTLAGGCPQELTITRTWSATDGCGNTSMCTQTIFVDDSTPPAIVCPANVTIQCTASTLPANTGTATATDNCSTPVVSYSDVTLAGGCPQEHTITRTWSATDGCGNTSMCAQTIFVDDSTPPVISCPSNVTIECTATTLPANTGTATATDNCANPVVTFTDVTLAGGCPQERTITRTWSATDGCGNTSICTQTIFVDDSTSPVISCPSNVTIQCTASTLPANTGTATATDNCSNPAVTFIDVTLAGGCPQERTITRTWSATDGCNTSTCTQTIFVDDSTAPVITCPASVTIECTASTLPANTGIATATDNCSAPAVTFTDVTLQGGCPQERTITRTWSATDGCGNTSTCSQTIFVDDSTPPLITCPASVTIQCTASTLPANSGTATATDNCSTPVVTFSDVTLQGGCPQERTITRTWSATDGCGNTSTCSQTIFVDDSTPPAITCPASVTIECTASTLPANTGTATATDNCSTPVVTFSDVTLQGGCPQERTITRTWSATDGCGNTSTCNQTILVDDSTAPVITCPASVTIQCTASTLPANTGTATATDNCSSPVVTFNDVTLQGGCPQERTITRTWSATDGCGNTSTCNQTIFVDDSTAPVITCPASVTIQCTASTLPANTGSATATDNCSTPAVTFSDVTVSGGCPQERTITRTWSATDGCGNTSTCNQTIFVDDSTPPSITCPASVTIQCTASTLPANTGTATATDNCSTPVVTFSDVTLQGGCPQERTITRTWSATDGCGNTSTCSQTIFVDDSTPPSITCPASVTIECTASTLPANTGTASATDNCSIPVVTFSDVTIQGGCPQERTITRTWSATDGCGNSSTCNQTIFVDDSTPPAITCPASVTIQCTASTLPANTGTATATDNCSTPVVTFSDVTLQGGCPQERTITRTWSATDGCGNTSTCNQIIFVDDSTPPAITCPASVTIECTASTLPANTGTATATDNCSTPAVTFSDVILPGGCPQELTITRTWSATDGCGNTSTCNQTIFVDDSTSPAITCPSSVTIECTASTLPANTGTATATDNCDLPGSATLWINELHYDNTGTDVGEFLEIAGSAGLILSGYSLVLYNGATGLVDATVPLSGIIDNESLGYGAVSFFIAGIMNGAPDGVALVQGSAVIQFLSWEGTFLALNGPAIGMTSTDIGVDEDPVPAAGNSLGLNGTGNSYIEFSWAGPSDDSPGTLNPSQTIDEAFNTGPTVTFSDVTIAGGCPQERTITRTWLATDDCGNTSTCNQIISVDDSTPPVITCPSSVTIECTASTLPANTGTATATDNCSTPVVTFNDVTLAGGCPQERTITRTWSATDGCGNTSNCTQTIFVNDSTSPVITCPSNLTIECTASTLPANTGTATATDNCSTPVVTFSDVTVAGGCPQEITITRTWSATDGCGNTSVCAQTIFVDDSTPPVITCPVNVTIECTASTLPANTGTATASDNCSVPTVTFSDVTVAGGCPQERTITRTWLATDACSNTSVCTQIINVDDSTPPNITCPSNLILECGDGSDYVALINAWTALVTATDNCDGSVMITDNYISGIPAVSCLLTSGLVVTFTATDDCGNSSTCTSTVYMDDTVSPLITCPADLILDCAPGASYPDTILAWIATATATDLCDQIVAITTNYDGDSIPAFTCEGGMSITFTATDDCGNTAECTRTVYKPCFDLEASVYIEGSAANPSGLNSFSVPMRTTLNNLQLLPGQSYFDPFFGIRYTQPGQPYDIAPWFYFGTEGDMFDTDSVPGDAGYPSTVVDWVLVSLRADAEGTGGALCMAAALLHNDGHIQFVEDLDCCSIDEADNYYIVIEHRNHLIVMSDSIEVFVNNKLTYDFRIQESYIEDFGFPGLFVGQKEIIPGVWAMFGGNGHQTAEFSDTDINFNDRTYWSSQNGFFGEYRIGDYNLNGDTNFNDRLLYERNNGLFTSVPRN